MARTVLCALQSYLMLAAALPASGALINGNFDTPVIGGPTPVIQQFAVDIAAYADSNVPGWTTTDIKGAIEIWKDGAQGFRAYTGTTQWAEINAYSASTMSQVVGGIQQGLQYGFAFAHRGRGSATVADVMRATFTDLGADGVLGGGDDTPIYTALYKDTKTAWGFYQVNFGIKQNTNNVLVQFTAVSTASGDASIGNFVTAAQLDNNVAANLAPIPEPSTALFLACGLLLISLADARNRPRRIALWIRRSARWERRSIPSVR